MYWDYKKDLEYFVEFTEIYKSESDINLREAICLKKQVPYILEPLLEDHLIAGEVKHGYVGFSPQYGGKYTYYFHKDKVEKAMDNCGDSLEKSFVNKVKEYISFWEKENTAEILDKRFSERFPKRRITASFQEGGVGNAGPRIAGTNVNLDKLLQLGIPGLYEEIEKYEKINGKSTFYTALKLTVDTIVEAIEFYEAEAKSLLVNSKYEEDLTKLKEALSNIKSKKPNSFLEAMELMWIYGVISDLMNYGRMDVYLGDFYVSDLEKGIIDEEEAIRYVTGMYRHLIKINKYHDARIILGGKGRRNEENANKLAILIMETTRRVRDVVPQLTFRYYSGINEELYNKALKVNQEGTSYPIIYSDDTNIPAVMEVYNVSQEEAENYVPFGCGEYVLEGRSLGTPNSGTNLLKALELALFNGVDKFRNEEIGVKTGKAVEFDSFAKLWQAYDTQVDVVMEEICWHNYLNYKVLEDIAPYLHMSLLMDDCIQRGKGLLQGGVRYYNASAEIFGMISAADSISGIKKCVYEDRLFSLEELTKMLEANFEGYEKEREILKKAPKYGNDENFADEMAVKVYEHISKMTIEKGKKTTLNKYNIVSVNNSMSAEWGEYCLASACGRKTGEPMANANGASIGADKNGVTALLNSMSKFDNTLHVGVINNVRFSKELFASSYEKVKELIRIFMENNGVQMNLMVIGVEDLKNAQLNPEKYENLIVRIGGFSARFVKLSPTIQNEIIKRTTYES